MRAPNKHAQRTTTRSCKPPSLTLTNTPYRTHNSHKLRIRTSHPPQPVVWAELSGVSETTDGEARPLRNGAVSCFAFVPNGSAVRPATSARAHRGCGKRSCAAPRSRGASAIGWSQLQLRQRPMQRPQGGGCVCSASALEWNGRSATPDRLPSLRAPLPADC